MGSFRIDSDGSFRIGHATPGTYELRIILYEPQKDRGRGFEKHIGSIRQEVDVPDIPGGRTDEKNATGYAKDIFKDVIGADVALVETVAHTENPISFQMWNSAGFGFRPQPPDGHP